MEVVKRVYAKPTILKVQLSHEQAVLSACTMVTASLSGLVRNFCKSGSPPCRQNNGPNGSDSTASS